MEARQEILLAALSSGNRSTLLGEGPVFDFHWASTSSKTTPFLVYSNPKTRTDTGSKFRATIETEVHSGKSRDWENDTSKAGCFRFIRLVSFFAKRLVWKRLPPVNIALNSEITMAKRDSVNQYGHQSNVLLQMPASYLPHQFRRPVQAHPGGRVMQFEYRRLWTWR